MYFLMTIFNICAKSYCSDFLEYMTLKGFEKQFPSLCNNNTSVSRHRNQVGIRYQKEWSSAGMLKYSVRWYLNDKSVGWFFPKCLMLNLGRHLSLGRRDMFIPCHMVLHCHRTWHEISMYAIYCCAYVFHQFWKTNCVPPPPKKKKNY